MKAFSVVLVSACALAAILFAGIPARADDTAQAGRSIVTKWQQAVVTIEVVSKTRMSMFGEEATEENKVEVRGVNIDPAGLIITSLTTMDPMSMIGEMMGEMQGEGEEEGMKSTTEITGAKIILSDGKTIPAQVVMRDKDLDLAFIRPAKKGDLALPAVSFDTAGVPELLDQVFILGRLGMEGSRASSITTERIMAVVEKPRRFYVMQNVEDPGTPVFTAEGKFVGITALRLPPKGMGGMKSLLGLNMIIVAVPADEIIELAKQAPQSVEK